MTTWGTEAPHPCIPWLNLKLLLLAMLLHKPVACFSLLACGAALLLAACKGLLDLCVL
jgi:hypothetical protein